MFLWVLLTIMTGAAVMTVLVPLSRNRSERARGRTEVGFYREQLAEIDRDEGRGLISAVEAASARTEAGRRLIQASESEPAAPAATGEPALRRRRAAAAMALSIVPLVALAVYGGLGSPELPAAPASARLADHAAPSTLGDAVELVEARLAAQPDDRRGWQLLAPLYLRASRFGDAARAYRALIRLGSDDPDDLTNLGAALIGEGDGVVSAEARRTLEQARERDPSSPRIAFYLALAAEQDGKAAEARNGYEAILAKAPADAPYRQVVQARLDAMSGRGPARLKGEPPPEIVAMVEGLDRRLAADGGSEAEWMRLVRSLAVLGREADARDRLAKAQLALAADPAAVGHLDRLAADLSIGSPSR